MKNKEWVKKLILIVLCIAIVLFIVVRNFFGGFGATDSNKNQKASQITDGITTAEALRYFSALFFTEEERQALEEISGYTLSKADAVYEQYLNAAINAHIYPNASGTQELDLSKELSCGQFRDMLWSVVDLLDLDYEEVGKSFPDRFQTVTVDDLITVKEFITVYEKLVQVIADSQESNQTQPRVQLQKLYFLGEETVNGQTTLCAQDGLDYSIDRMNNYLNLFLKDGESESNIEADGTDAYVGQYLSVMTCGSEVLYLREKLTEDVVLNNVYILSGKDQTIETFLSDRKLEFQTNAVLSDEIADKIGDLTIRNGKVVGVIIKPDIIHGKVLLTGKSEIEVEGYGVLPLHDEFKIYKLYGEMEMEKTNSILVGYSVTDFIVSEGKICAALIKEPIKAQNIRVLIHSSGYESIYHDSITLTSDTDYTIDDGDSIVTFSAGESMKITTGMKLMESGRIRITSTKEDGRIELSSIKRNYGTPKYRGSIEIAVTEKGLIVVNELSIEEYLYAVVPSEMPTTYGDEALKVQAVCARSYAFKQLMANRYSAYGAHVDDSVSCQVYNNVEENEASILAVKETFGQVLMADGAVITAYYFSTSCGSTADVSDVWEDSKETEYLKGAFQTEDKPDVDFSDEAAFREFIMNDSIEVMQGHSKVEQAQTTYDSGYLMYRWKVTMDVNALSKQINSVLQSRYQVSPSSLLTYVTDVTEAQALESPSSKIVNGKVFVSRSITGIGTVKSITVTDRAQSGIIREMIIEGTDHTVLVRYQTNIRTLLAPVATEITRADQSTISGMSLLPSAFCVIDPVKTDGKVTAFEITGGGFGHGVGMSQNGVKAMVNQGKTYDQILNHYYQGSTIEIIYNE